MLLPLTAQAQQQHGFGGRERVPVEQGRFPPGHQPYGYPRGWVDNRPAGLGGLIPGLVLGLGLSALVQQAPARVAPGYPQPPPGYAQRHAATPDGSNQQGAPLPH